MIVEVIMLDFGEVELTMEADFNVDCVDTFDVLTDTGVPHRPYPI
jgi:hypothetical protein